MFYISIYGYDMIKMMNMISKVEYKRLIIRWEHKTFFWNAPEVDTHTKYLIYIAISFNLLLWRCESWVTNLDELIKKVFHLRCIRGILGISWDNVREDDISNIQVRKKLITLKMLI